MPEPSLAAFLVALGFEPLKIECFQHATVCLRPTLVDSPRLCLRIDCSDIGANSAAPSKASKAKVALD
jgi:hypothetical protein